jgi:DegV family protein with EDD domain
MGRIRLITDAASDLSYENEKRYDIQVVPFKIALGEKSYTSRIDFSNDAFYQLMEDYGGIPVTSQITPFEFSQIFEKHYEDGYTDVINVSINSAGSATHSNAMVAERMFFGEHPEAEGRFFIYNIDSASYSGCYGYPVVEAAKMIENGASAEAAAAFISDWCERVCVFLVPYSLKYAAKSGRIPSVVARMGNALGIKPVIRLHDHELGPVGRVRSEKQIVPEIAARTLHEIEGGSPYCILYGSDITVRDEMAAVMTERLGYPPADAYQIGAAIAANIGPKIIGVIFRSRKPA